MKNTIDLLIELGVTVTILVLSPLLIFLAICSGPVFLWDAMLNQDKLYCKMLLKLGL